MQGDKERLIYKVCVCVCEACRGSRSYRCCTLFLDIHQLRYINPSVVLSLLINT